MLTAQTSQRIEKLAFIRRKAYLIGDFGGVDYRHRGTLALTDIRSLGSANPDKPLRQRLTAPFGKAVGGAMLAATMLATPAAAKDVTSVNQSDAAVQTVGMMQPVHVSFDGVEIIEDADFAAASWVADHSDRLAIPVRLGLDTEVAPERLEEVLRADFAANGITNIKFFYELGGRGDTTVAYVSDKYVSPQPYALGTARDHVATAASQFKFNQQLAYNRY